jgi:hypothetical protein
MYETLSNFAFNFNLRHYTVDVAALTAGNLMEVLNLVPFGGVTLDLLPVTARGVHGWPAGPHRYCSPRHPTFYYNGDLPPLHWARTP